MDSRNTDRHLGNFGALIDNNTMSITRMAPVFDNNRSLLFDMNIDQLKNTAFYSNHDLLNHDLRSFWVVSPLLACVVCC